MRRTTVTGLVLAVATGAGCASKTNTSMLAALAPASTVPVVAVCDSTTCKAQWERAQLWIAKHSVMKVQTATDGMITTYGPGSDPRYGFTVLREPSDGGRYRVSLTMACGNIFGCNPKPIDIERAFYHYVVTGKDLLEGLGYLGGIRMP